MGILIPRRTLLGVTFAAAGSMFIEPAHADNLVVVVHEGVGQKTFSVQELAAMFTTRKRNFDSGERIIALNLPPRTEERVAFDQIVLGMDPDEVARYWIDRKVRGGDPPPKQVPNVPMMAKLVQRLPGTIGYLPASAAQGLRIVARL